MEIAKKNKWIIAGPCALESREQLRTCCIALKQLGVTMIRASLWKPRTQPGWEGLGKDNLPMLLEETFSLGLTPATEIISAEHASQVVECLSKFNSEAKMVVWLGARNQNHLEQQKIARILASVSQNIILMCKNQMWDDDRHWLGIAEHILSVGFPVERLWLCHRGFSPGKMANPEGYRNLPDYEMAMRIKARTGIPMLLDPSHIGGTRENVVKVVEKSQSYDFDGWMIEVHNQPEKAKTDIKQQLSMQEFSSMLQKLREVQPC